MVILILGVVYISESGPYLDRIRRLAIMDQDGHNHKFLTDGSYMILSPRFSPSSQEITYLSYYNDTPRVYLYSTLIRVDRKCWVNLTV